MFISGKNKQQFSSLCVCVFTANHSGSSRHMNDVVDDGDRDICVTWKFMWEIGTFNRISTVQMNIIRLNFSGDFCVK